MLVGAAANLLPVIGCLLFVFAFAIAAAALLLDRSRGRRRCPRCWYDMSASPGLQCSECGHAARSERNLHRTRRRWRWAALALLIALAGYGAEWALPRVQRSGWRGGIPTTFLVWWAGHYEPPERYVNNAVTPPTPLAAELALRLKAEEPWRWQWRWLLGGMEAVRIPERWPRGEPLRVSTGVPEWLQGAVRHDFASTLPNAEAAMWFHLFAWNAGDYPDMTAAASSASAAAARSGENPAIIITAGSYRMAWPLHVELVDRPEQAIEPVKGPEIDAALRAALAASLVRSNNAAAVYDSMVGARLYREKGPVPDDIAVGVIVEFVHDGAVVGSTPLCMLDSSFGPPVDWVRVDAPKFGPGGLSAWDAAPDDEGFKGWTVRIRGDATTSLKDVKRSRYWAGEWETPLKVFMGG